MLRKLGHLEASLQDPNLADEFAAMHAITGSISCNVYVAGAQKAGTFGGKPAGSEFGSRPPDSPQQHESICLRAPGQCAWSAQGFSGIVLMGYRWVCATVPPVYHSATTRMCLRDCAFISSNRPNLMPWTLWLEDRGAFQGQLKEYLHINTKAHVWAWPNEGMWSSR